MINKILLTSAGRYSEKSSSFLGIEGENKANTLLFEFSDGFIDGLGQLYIERGSDIGYVNLIKNENSYELPVMSSLLSKVGEINMQVVITKADGTIIKYDKFTMLVKDAIDTDIPLPEEYPSWTSTISEMLSKTQDAIDEANTISEQLLKDKEDGAFNGKDGKDGKDGFSPIATVTQTDTGATISITDTNGTTIATVKNGKDGSSGILEETDPVYLADKPNIALKSELPTKVSELQNDSKFISSYTETDPTVPNHVKGITQENITKWNNKSEFSGSYNDLTDKPTIPSVEGLATTEQLTQGLATKQDILTAGDNITIENGVISSTGGNSSSGDSTPVGNIISFMGTIAPDGYLICDGTVLNVADYPKLASHFETQFGSKSYFGGDGTTTFAVPDLRNEFLRGYGDRTNEIGIHQDATNLPNIYTANNGKGLLVPLYNASSGITSQANNVDSQKNEIDYGTDSSKYQISQFNGSLITDSNYGSVMQSYTARPTNVAVLYCIKY